MGKTSVELDGIISEGISSDEAKLISEKIESVVDARVESKLELEKELVEAEVKEKYDSILAEKTESFEKQVQELEESTVAKCEEFRTKLTEETQKQIEELKEQKAEEMETFTESIITKLDEYLDLEISKAIPEDQVENSAKVAVLEPIVKGFKDVFNENYMRFDEEQFGLLKESREEILKLRTELAESVKSQMEQNKELKSFERDVKISKVCEGLTEPQCERAKKLLEGVDASEVESRFKMIRDLIIAEEVEDTEEEVTSTIVESVDGETEEVELPSEDAKVVTEDVDADEDLETEVVTESVDPKQQEIEEYAKLAGLHRK